MKGKIYVIISALILLIAIIGSTFALVYFRSEGTSVNLISDAELGNYINYKSGDPILGDDGKILEVGSTYTSGLSTEIEFWKTANAHNMDIYGHIYLNIDKGSKELLNLQALKWSVTSNDVLISEGNFVGYSEGGSVPLLTNQKLLSRLTKFKIYIWIDENDNLNGTVNGQDFEVTISCEATSGEYKNLFSGEFDYTGDVQMLNIKGDGIYKLEVWGAQGYNYSDIYYGGYGSYSSGLVNLSAGDTLYIHVGGQGIGGNEKTTYLGGYNGGGTGALDNINKYTGSGGGATHIALVDGLLSTLSNKIDDILIVAGGGGACYTSSSYKFSGGNAGGYNGSSGIQLAGGSRTLAGGGTQLAGGTAGVSGNAGSFGQGAGSTSSSVGGGGGFYGGGSGWDTAGGGGSGYIGNPHLTEKVMYCYNCKDSSEEEDETNIKTISTLDVNEIPISNTAKIGNGYAKITNLLSNDINIISRKTISYGTDYDFKAIARSEIGEELTITYSTFDNANELSTGEYQINYIAVDTDNNKQYYIQKVEIVD